MSKYIFVALITLCCWSLTDSRRDYKLPESVRDGDINDLVGSMVQQDRNKASSRDYRVNFQGHTNSRSRTDNAQQKLFTSVSSRLLSKPSYAALMKLFDNYNPSTGVREHSSRTEDREVDRFLDIAMNSTVMTTVMRFLKTKRYKPAKTPESFRTFVKQLWFGQYSRARGQLDTSGFEHVFIGEWKNGVSGLHNWLRFYYLEKSGTIDYKGFIIKRGTSFAMIQYSWGQQLKPSGSFFIGTSPEFDFALYTLCFIAKPGYNACKFTIDRQKFTVTSYDTTQRGKMFIGTLFPSPARR